jgi:hypothetical protein
MPYLPLLLNIGCPPFNKKHPFGPPSVLERDLQSGEGAKGVLLLGIAKCPRKIGEGPFKCSSFKTKIKK